MKKTYNTPHRTHVVKTRMTEDEYADFSKQLSLYGISQAEFIRRAIRGLPIHPIIKVSPVNDELLSSIGKLTAEYGKIGGNLNQIARSLNEYGASYRELASDVRADYRISSLNCGGEDFAVSCMRANLRYGKNQKKEDVKSHQEPEKAGGIPPTA